MKLRVPSLFFAALSAQAQNPGATVESLASDLAALTARVAKLKGQIVAADLVGAAKEDRSHGHGRWMDPGNAGCRSQRDLRRREAR